MSTNSAQEAAAKEPPAFGFSAVSMKDPNADLSKERQNTSTNDDAHQLGVVQQVSEGQRKGL